MRRSATLPRGRFGCSKRSTVFDSCERRGGSSLKKQSEQHAYKELARIKAWTFTFRASRKTAVVCGTTQKHTHTHTQAPRRIFGAPTQQDTGDPEHVSKSRRIPPSRTRTRRTLVSSVLCVCVFYLCFSANGVNGKQTYPTPRLPKAPPSHRLARREQKKRDGKQKALGKTHLLPLPSCCCIILLLPHQLFYETTPVASGNPVWQQRPAGARKWSGSFIPRCGSAISLAEHAQFRGPPCTQSRRTAQERGWGVGGWRVEGSIAGGRRVWVNLGRQKRVSSWAR